jgi:hypothetical protein
MGEGTWSLRDMLRKADTGEVHLRTHEAIRIGGDGYGREHSPDLHPLRDAENEGGPQHSSQSETPESISSGNQEIKDTNAIWKGIKMETKNGRNNSASQDWRQFITTTQANAESNAAKNGDAIPMMEKAALVASAMLEKNITSHDISMIALAMSVAKVSEDRNNLNNYREMITSAAYAGSLVTPPPGGFSEVRVMADLANQIASVASAT